MQNMKKTRLIASFAFLMLLSPTAGAQTPVANRIRALVNHLPKGAKVVARYTDAKRHSLYYILDNWLYTYDVWNNRKEKVAFSNEAYSKIMMDAIAPGGKYLVFCIDRGMQTGETLENRYQLWQLDSNDKKTRKMGIGFFFRQDASTYTLTEATRCRNPHAPEKLRQWYVKDHKFNASGEILSVSEEYLWRKN